MENLRRAFIVRGIGFAVRHVRPMILDPTGGNGPLAGMFITGVACVVVRTVRTQAGQPKEPRA